MREVIVVATLLSSAFPANAGCDRWKTVNSPDVSKNGDNTFASVAGLKANDVWAVGQFAPDSNVNITQTFTAHYDGSTWSAIASPNVGKQANALHSVALPSSGRAWAVGYYIDDKTFYSRSLIEFWNGTAWNVVAHPDDPGNSAVLFGVSASASNDVWAVGEYQQPLDVFHTLVEHFDGKKWKIVPSPDPGASGNILYGVTALASDAVWAVGERNGALTPDKPLIIRWIGERWLVETPPADGQTTTRLYQVAADQKSRLHAAGEAENDARRTDALSEINRQGRNWAIQATQSVGNSDNHFYGTGAAPDGTAWAVGAWFDPSSGRQFTLTERMLPGEEWLEIPSPSPSRRGDSLLSSVAVVGSDVWAVGAYDGPAAQRSLILQFCKP